VNELFYSAAFGLSLSVAAYWVGTTIQKKTGLVIFNGLIIAGVLIIALLLAFDIPFEAYNVGGSLISAFMTPLTVVLAISIYENRALLKKRLLPVVVGCIVGAVTATFSGYFLCRLLGLDDVMTMSLLPKSVTTPVALSISNEKGGLASITMAAVVLTGVGGNLLAPLLCKLFRTQGPTESGLAIGACSHAVGTARAMEMGKEIGAMSGLALSLCAIITSIVVLFI